MNFRLRGGVTSHHLLSIDVNDTFYIDPARDLYPGFDNSSAAALYFWAHELGRCTNGSRAVASGCTVGPSLPALDDSHRALFHAALDEGLLSLFFPHSCFMSVE